MKRSKFIVGHLALICAISLAFQSGQRALAKPPQEPQIELTVLGTYASGIFDAGGAEIVAFDPASQRLYVVNAQDASLDTLDLSDPTAPTKINEVSLLPFGGVANSVAVHEGLVAVAVEAVPDRTAPGVVAFFDSDLQFISSVTVGAVPDMLGFTPRGRYVLVANEGEPSGYGPDHTDPEGSISIIDLRDGPETLSEQHVRTAGFGAWNGSENVLRAAGIRIYGPGATASRDLEPEYIAISPDGATAWATLQENNALAVIDIASATVTSLIPLGLKDHNLPVNAFDASDRDNTAGTGPAIKIANYPVKGMYQPDTIAAHPIGAQLFLFTANEGDAREWPGLIEEVAVGSSSYSLDSAAFPNASTLKENRNLGRLRVSKNTGDLDGDGDYDEIHLPGARSFSIRATDGSLLFDSGADFELVTASLHPAVIFNASNTSNNFDNRSPRKGPEPEALAIGRAFQRTWAFIGLERVGGVMVYDVSNPLAPRLVTYANNRNFTNPFSFANAGDLGPECLLFIDEDDSPTGEPLLVVANEISGTTTIFQVTEIGD